MALAASSSKAFVMVVLPAIGVEMNRELYGASRTSAALGGHESAKPAFGKTEKSSIIIRES